ncbi:hypothetical protein [Paenibacillus methanolicus]|uniref:Uncharacterized protein n=1 Tax=Paenibacillus methanolicus TaxID=582686 RepID=A0A5S5CGG4_9BACL|nr:hypothetical protein [Paenibacillus methanolicus]TYP77768.1 hypothetical protein BCM02_102332 [Paenibacillus methanolicus]
MTVWKRLLGAVGAALVVTALLTLLPIAERRMQNSQEGIAVFRASPIHKLETRNLVDSMIAQKLKLPIRKADWKEGVLSVDLAVDGMPGRIDLWMRDLQQLADLSYVQTSNVNRLLVRFVKADAAGGRSTVMQAAADIRRTDEWLAGALTEVGGARPDLDPVWRERLRMSFVR